MAPQDEASRWLQQAQQEIRDAEDLRRRERFYLAALPLSASSGESPMA
jgi:hypothetical protein